MARALPRYQGPVKRIHFLKDNVFDFELRGLSLQREKRIDDNGLYSLDCSLPE